MPQEPRYYIRQAGGAAQGPYDFSKIEGYRDAGRISAEMDFSEDGETWWKGSDWPALFPATAPKRPPMPQQSAAPPRHRSDRPQRRPRRQQRRKSGVPMVAVVIGLLAAIGIAVAVLNRGGDEREAVSRVRTGPFVPRNDTPERQPVKSDEPHVASPSRASAPSLPTKRRIRAKIVELVGERGGIGGIEGGEKKLIEALGEPSRTQSVGENVYYYFKARDGTIQVVVHEAFRFGGPFMVTDINDY